MKLKLIPVFLVAIVAVAGCPKNQTPYGVASKLGDDVGIAVKDGSTLVDNLRKSNTITVQDERTALAYFSNINTLNGVYLNCVAGAHSAGDTITAFEACGDTFLTAAQNPATLAALRVSNADSQSAIMVKVGVIQGIIRAAETTLDGLRGKP